MIVTLPDGREIEAEWEVEEGGYKILDVYDVETTSSLIYDRDEFGLTQAQADAIYRQAELDWCDRQADRADNLRKLAKEGG
jgi:hypothetical protein